MGDDDATAVPQDATETPAKPPQHPFRKRHTGGKKGARKPSKLLRAMRWCFETAPKDDEVLTPERAQCRLLQRTEPVEFMKMLRDLEKALVAGKPKEVPGSSGTGTSASGSGGLVPLDKGELTVREMIDKLLKDFPGTKAGDELAAEGQRLKMG